MISVKKIAHAVYEMPDVDKQTEYYTEVIGLTQTDKGKDAVYLASTVDHHSVVLRKGSQARCVRLGFQIGPEEDLGVFEKQVQGHGIKTERRKDPEPTISDMVTFEDPKGTVMEVFKRDAFSGQRFPAKGIVPHKLGHVAFFVTDVKRVTKFYCDVLGFRESDWMGDFFSFLRCGRDHHTINLMQIDANRHFHRIRVARLVPPADRLRFSQSQWLQAALGARAPRHRSQSLRLSSRSQRLDHRAVRRTRPSQRGARLLRAAALAPRSPAETEGMAQGSVGREFVGRHAAGRDDEIGGRQHGAASTCLSRGGLRPDGCR